MSGGDGYSKFPRALSGTSRTGRRWPSAGGRRSATELLAPRRRRATRRPGPPRPARNPQESAPRLSSRMNPPSVKAGSHLCRIWVTRPGVDAHAIRRRRRGAFVDAVAGGLRVAFIGNMKGGVHLPPWDDARHLRLATGLFERRMEVPIVNRGFEAHVGSHGGGSGALRDLTS